MNEQPNLTKLLAQSTETATQFDERIHGLQISNDKRTLLCSCCLHAALEHGHAIRLLLRESLCGTAFSLVRPLFEAYVRGVWLYCSASEDDLDDFEMDQLDKRGIKAFIEDIRAERPQLAQLLSAVVDEYWPAMCGYTHCGHHQVGRRVTASRVEPNYAEDEIMEVLTHTDAIGLLAIHELASIAGDEALADQVAEAFRRL